MGLILAGILGGALFLGITFLYLTRSKDPEAITVTLLAILLILSVGCGIAAGIVEPVSGYCEPEKVSTTELISLRDDVEVEGTGRLLYVSISGTNSYTYYVEVDSPFASDSQKAYKSNTISDNNVRIKQSNIVIAKDIPPTTLK